MFSALQRELLAPPSRVNVHAQGLRPRLRRVPLMPSGSTAGSTIALRAAPRRVGGSVAEMEELVFTSTCSLP